MLEIKDLCCVREQRQLFQQLSFTAHSGEVVQICGPNGVGKTSLLRLIAGLSIPETGTIHWQGQDIRNQAESFAQASLYIGHQSGLKGELSALENLQFYQRLSGQNHDLNTLYALLARVGLAGFEDISAAQLSAGQQRRAALARLWLMPKHLWILDEPLTALDKQGVSHLEQVMLEHVEQGGCIVLTTHQPLSMPSDRHRVIEIEPAEDDV